MATVIFLHLDKYFTNEDCGTSKSLYDVVCTGHSVQIGYVEELTWSIP